MDDTMGNEGINKLAGVFQGRMKSMSDKPQVLDFGTIQRDMSLVTNQFPKPIPRTDFMVCRQLTQGIKLKPGDRVLVAWVGDDACVVDIILPATFV